MSSTQIKKRIENSEYFFLDQAIYRLLTVILIPYTADLKLSFFQVKKPFVLRI